MKSRIFWTLFFLVVAVVGAGVWLQSGRSPSPGRDAVPDYEGYDYGRDDASRVIDIATQPSDLSPAFISECLFHDRVLQEQLAASGWTLREHRYNSGNDIVPYCDGRLDLMFMGDFPALVAMASRPVCIVAITSHGYDTIIASDMRTPKDLKGLRVGYPPGSSARFTLERMLDVAHLAFADIVSVPLQPRELEAALRDHRVDAVIAWEPTASRILANVPDSHPAFRSETITYAAMDLDFCARQPQLQKALLAALLRAARWGGEDEQNLYAGLGWVREAELDYTGKSAIVADRKWVTILRQEGIDSPSFPMLPRDLSEPGRRFHRQFQWLQGAGRLAATQDWTCIQSAIDFTVLPGVIREGTKWQVDRFHYCSDKLCKAGGGGALK